MSALNFKGFTAVYTGVYVPPIFIKNRVGCFVACLAGALLLAQSAFAQAPVIGYSSSTYTLVQGTSFSTIPSNTGGTVPLNTLGLISTFAGSTAGTSGRTTMPQGLLQVSAGPGEEHLMHLATCMLWIMAIMRSGRSLPPAWSRCWQAVPQALPAERTAPARRRCRKFSLLA